MLPEKTPMTGPAEPLGTVVKVRARVLEDVHNPATTPGTLQSKIAAKLEGWFVGWSKVTVMQEPLVYASCEPEGSEATKDTTEGTRGGVTNEADAVLPAPTALEARIVTEYAVS
jgi:hypothetical protein